MRKNCYVAGGDEVGCWLKCCFTSTETVGLLGTGAQDVHLDFHTAPELWGGLFQTRNMNEAKQAGNAPWHDTMLRTDRTYIHGTLNTRGMWRAFTVQTTYQLRTHYNCVTNVQLNAFIVLPSIISTVAMETVKPRANVQLNAFIVLPAIKPTVAMKAVKPRANVQLNAFIVLPAIKPTVAMKAVKPRANVQLNAFIVLPAIKPTVAMKTVKPRANVQLNAFMVLPAIMPTVATKMGRLGAKVQLNAFMVLPAIMPTVATKMGRLGANVQLNAFMVLPAIMPTVATKMGRLGANAPARNPAVARKLPSKNDLRSPNFRISTPAGRPAAYSNSYKKINSLITY